MADRPFKIPRLDLWRVLREERALSRPPWLEVWAESVGLPDGRCVEPYYRINQPDYTVVFALPRNHHVIGVWHYKHGPHAITLGLPAGYVNPGETAHEAARRELLEEAGYTATQWEFLGRFCVDGNRGCGWAHVFLAQDLTLDRTPDPDDLEELFLEELSFADLKSHLEEGRVLTLGAAAAVALGLLHCSVPADG